MTHRASLIIFPLLLAAFYLRIYNIDAQALSGDEAFTITQWGTVSINTLLTEIARTDPQPPVALLSYRAWIQLAGPSEFAVRFLSALFSLVTVAGSFALSRKVTARPVPLMVMLFCATNPFQIWYGQDARPYSEWMAISLLTLTAFLHALPSQHLRPWLIYIALATISLHTFYLELFSLAAFNLYALYHFYRNQRLNRRWLISQIAVICSFVPWLIYSEPQNSPYQPTASFPDIPAAITELIFGTTVPINLSGVLPTIGSNLVHIILLTIAIIAVYVVAKSNPSQHKHLILFEAILPFLLLTILSIATGKAFFRARYIAITAIPLLIILASFAISLYRNSKNTLAFYLFVSLILALNIGSLTQYHFNPQHAKAPPWRNITAILKTAASPQDIIILNYPDPAFPYYYQGPAATTILPSDENPPPELTIQQLSPLPQKHRHLWFLRVDTPFWDRQQVVATWLDTNTAYLTDTWIRDMRLYEYASWEPSLEFVPNQLNTDLGLVTLQGYQITPSPPYLALPQTLTIELFWQPLQRTTTDLRIFVHLISTNPDGTINLSGQDDHPPQQGRHSTTTWPIDGTILRDVYHIPLNPDLPDGRYTLTTGFYDPSTFARYSISNGITQPEQDGILITTIQVSTRK